MESTDVFNVPIQPNKEEEAEGGLMVTSHGSHDDLVEAKKSPIVIESKKRLRLSLYTWIITR
jgi:hypothetical protein